MEDNGKGETVYHYQEGRPVADFMDEPKFYFQDIHQGGEQDMKVSCGGAGRYCSPSWLPKASVEVCVYGVSLGWGSSEGHGGRCRWWGRMLLACCHAG